MRATMVVGYLYGFMGFIEPQALLNHIIQSNPYVCVSCSSLTTYLICLRQQIFRGWIKVARSAGKDKEASVKQVRG